MTTRKALSAALPHPARLGDPIALTVNFAAAIVEGAFEVMARPMRTSRSTQHSIIELLQAGEVAATATAVSAQRRETWSAPEALAPINAPPADSLPPGDTTGRPTWTQRYDMRFIGGDLPTAFDTRWSITRADPQPVAAEV